SKGTGKVTANGIEVATISGTQSLTNKTLDNTTVATIKDANLTLQDNGDTTKQAKFQLNNISPSTTRTFSLPDMSGTLATTDTVNQIINDGFSQSFPTPVSAFSFSEGSGSTAHSNYGSYTMTATTPSTAWNGGQAADEFIGGIGTNSPVSWSIG